MTKMTEENKIRALGYLNASISLDFRRNKGIYSMIAKLYAAINNQIGAYANAWNWAKFLIIVNFSLNNAKDELSNSRKYHT